MDQVNVVALCGSTRASSMNLALLKAAALHVPAGMRVTSIVDGRIAPHYNPDYEARGAIPRSAARWRELAGEADGIILSSPEYAGGIPGTFKNALDWLVGEPRFYRKPVAILSASNRSVGAALALRLVLSTMSADLIESASINLPLLGKGESELEKPEHWLLIHSALIAFMAEITSLKQPRPRLASNY